MSQNRVRVIVSGAFFAVFGAVTLWQSLAIHYTTSLGPGPGFFGVWMGAGMLVLSGLLIGRDLLKNRTGGERPSTVPAVRSDPPAGRAGDGPPRERLLSLLRRPPVRVGATLIALFALVFLMPLLGYRVAVFLFAVVIMKVVTAQSWLATVLVALATSVLVFYVFHDLLNVALPVNGLGF